MGLDSRLRRVAKNIPPLYWLGGLANYAKFRMALNRENTIFRSGNPSNLPPPILRYRVQRLFDEHSYLHNGRTIAQALAGAFVANGVELKNLTVLDFACGPGRVISEFAGISESCALHASDIDAEAIAWAQSNLSKVAHFSTNTCNPPTRFASETFDAIYCVSLFTHLDERAQDEWLREMKRLLKPNGVFVTTTHGRFALDSCTPAELAGLQRDGIVYRVDRKGKFKVDGLPDFYQTTFHTTDYVKAHWGRFLSVIDHLEGALNGHQDIVVMRKSGIGAC
jgi:ubiquinone/menaquinone biosynthesis C-methylase UbiE